MRIAITSLLLILVLSTTATGHHSVPVNFDMDNTVSIKGVLKETHWRNPHSHLILEVTNDSGDAEIWLVEWNAINTIRRLLKKDNISTDDFLIDSEITVIGWMGRNDNSVYLREVTFEDGRHFIWRTRLNPAEQRVE